MNLSSKNKKIVIFSDVHHEIKKLDRILKHESADINLCLGDWFDSHSLENLNDYTDTAKYLLKYLENKNNLTLYGNHDLNYLFNASGVKCSGYTDLKFLITDAILHDKNAFIQDKFKWFATLDDNWLVSHAGIHPRWLRNANLTDFSLKTVSDLLATESPDALIKLNRNQFHWFYNCGEARGGIQVGGLVWLDFNTEFVPIENLLQIVGHTYKSKIRSHAEEKIKDVIAANNICIDTNLNEYLTLTNGKLELKRYSDL